MQNVPALGVVRSNSRTPYVTTLRLVACQFHSQTTALKGGLGVVAMECAHSLEITTRMNANVTANGRHLV